MKGRKPTPTNLKILRGNPGRRPINKNEPVYVDGQIEVPNELSGEDCEIAREEWKKIAPQLLSARVYKRIDRTSLIAYCLVFQRWIKSEAEVRKFGSLIRTKSGWLTTNPHLKIAETALSQMRALISDFGMNPSARTRLQISEDQQMGDEFDEYLNCGTPR